MADNGKKLINAENLKQVASSVYAKTQSNLQAEAKRADAAEKANAAAIAQEAEDRAAAITKEAEDRAAAIAQEVQDRNDAIEEATTFENGITTVNVLGGIGSNVSLDGKTALEILDMLLFPYVKQTVGNVSRTPNATLLEKGNNQTITAVSAVVTKKSKPITKVELLNGSTVIATKEGDAVKNGGTIKFEGLSVPVNSTNVVLTVRATDENGSQVTANTAGWTFVYPYFYGVVDAGTTINEAVVERLTKDVQSKGNKTYSYNTNNQCAVIAFPKAHGVLKSALDPNAFENLPAFTRYEVSITGLDGTAQAYYVYVSGAFTGSGFKYTFKH